MGDEEQRCAGALLQGEEEVHDLRTGGKIEIAGGLVSEDEGGPRAERSGDCHSLLLAARELAREMRLAMRQPDLGKGSARGVEDVVMVEEFERQRHVLDRCHGGHEVEGLEDDTDIGGTKPGEAVLVQPGEIGAEHRYAAFGGMLEPGDDHEQRRFARAARADHGDGTAHLHAEVDASQDRHRAGARRQRDMQSFEQNRRRLFQGVIHGRGKQ